MDNVTIALSSASSRRKLMRGLFFTGLFIVFSLDGGAYQGSNQEYKFKAAYLFNFLQFTEWPAGAFETESSPVIIGILGRDPFGGALEQMVQGESINGRKVLIKRIQEAKDVKGCHVLFIPRSEEAHIGEILAAESRALTVSEVRGFTDRGGAISFFVQDNKLRFEINPVALKKADLRVSSRLLRLAKLVGPTSDEN